jgi:hypothetical protein
LKILIDECVPWPIHNLLTGHTCQTAQQSGWAGKKNGELLQLAESNGFDLFLTADQNIRYQQNLSGRRIAILELSTNKLRRIESAAALLQQAVDTIAPAAFVSLRIP